MNVLLSIKHQYAWLIADGRKRVEYRSRVWDDAPEFVYVYAGRPIKCIIGRFHPGKIITGDKFRVWEQTKQDGGIDDLDFFDYFTGVGNANAIVIELFELFHRWVDPYSALPGYHTVQSFRYLPEEWEEIILEKATGLPAWRRERQAE